MVELLEKGFLLRERAVGLDQIVQVEPVQRVHVESPVALRRLDDGTQGTPSKQGAPRVRMCPFRVSPKASVAEAPLRLIRMLRFFWVLVRFGGLLQMNVLLRRAFLLLFGMGLHNGGTKSARTAPISSKDTARLEGLRITVQPCLHLNHEVLEGHEQTVVVHVDSLQHDMLLLFEAPRNVPQAPRQKVLDAALAALLAVDGTRTFRRDRGSAHGIVGPSAGSDLAWCQSGAANATQCLCAN
mmetsp:Transcript_7675/g.19010  ORF Transcript_7675/g.19010 Transcript_7675/m.19010 type:complete len:241 (+) Transcript_7675:744-1466(+)